MLKPAPDIEVAKNQPKSTTWLYKLPLPESSLPESELVLSKNCLDDFDDRERTNEQMIKINEANKNEEAQFKLLAFNGVLEN